MFAGLPLHEAKPKKIAKINLKVQSSYHLLFKLET
jgi:hypothetical protein